MLTVRDAIPKPQPLARAEFATLHARLLKIAARITKTASPVRIAFAAACPVADLFRRVARKPATHRTITAGASAPNALSRQPSTPDMTNRRSRTTRYGQTLPSLRSVL